MNICRNWALIAFISFFLLSSCSQEKSKPVSLVKNGISSYSILLNEGASDEEKRAAAFLQEHILEISDCKIPILTINQQKLENYISISKSTKISNPDGFQIVAQQNNIQILGGSNKGCIYAIADILEKELNVRYYSPEYIVIPKSSSVLLPKLNYSDSSINTYRVVHGHFLKHENYKDFHRLHSISDVFARDYYVHTFHKLLPWKEYFQKHPEYYAFMNGKRIKDQLCLTNPDVLQITIDKLREGMKAQPEKDIWSVSQDDNFSYCQCKNCSQIINEEESPAGPIIRFVNEVAQEFPEKTISTLAYQYSRKAPVKTKPLKNVQVMLCTIELNRSIPISKDSSSVSFIKDMEDWGKICNHIYLWDYTADFAHSVSPFPNLHVLQPNIQLFTENNIKEHFQQSNTAVGNEFSELKSYLLSKLLWNPYVKVDSIIKEFTDGFYGDAAPYIRDYINHMEEEIIETAEWLDIYGPPTNYQKTFLSYENIAAYNSYFNKAKEAVINQPDFLLHVSTAQMPLQYAQMEIGKNDMFGKRGWYIEKEGEYILKEQMTDVLEKFYRTSQQTGFKYLNESRLTAEEYYYSTKRFIDIQIDGNLAFQKKVTAKPMPAKKYSGGKLSYLTNGVKGANDYKVHWLGWENQDFELILDLENIESPSNIEISTLWDQKSWIMHPIQVSCYVSKDSVNYKQVGKRIVQGNQKNEEVNKTFKFETIHKEYQYVKFDIKGSLKLFDWHPSAGYPSWVFVDEIVVK